MTNVTPQSRPRFERLGERTRLMLQRLNDGVLIAEDDLCTMVWPEPVTRQARQERFARWLADGYLQQVEAEEHTCYQLGRRGALLLRDAGYAHIAPTRPIAHRVQHGLLLANRFGAALHRDIQGEPGVAGMAWAVRPFHGASARADGLAAICYDIDGLPVKRTRPDAYLPECLDGEYVPPPGCAVMRLVVEIDSGTEDVRQLVQRARNWRKRWERTVWPPNTHAIFVWLTEGASARLEAIQTVWTHYALLPAFFTAIATLDAGAENGWHPWRPHYVLRNGSTFWLWRDASGRTRSLRPWDLDEWTLRFE